MYVYWASMISVNLSLMSCVLSGYMAHRLASEIRINSTVNNIVRAPLLGLFISNFIFTVWLLSGLAPPLFIHPPTVNLWVKLDPSFCVFFALFGTFSFIGICFWSLIINWLLFMVLLGFSSTWLSQYITHQTVLLFTIWFGCLLFGIYYNSFGPQPGTISECGLLGNTAAYIFHTIPILISLCSSIMVVLMAIYRRKMFHQHKNQYLLLDIASFSFVFVVLWFLPAFVRIIELLGYRHDDAWYWHAAFDVIFSLSGTSYFIVWHRLSRQTYSTLNKVPNNLHFMNCFINDANTSNEIQKDVC